MIFDQALYVRQHTQRFHAIDRCLPNLYNVGGWDSFPQGRLPMHTLHPGEWYLRYICVKCESRQVLFPDMSKGEAPIHATYRVACYECGNQAAYDEDVIERYYHPEDAEPVFSN